MNSICSLQMLFNKHLKGSSIICCYNSPNFRMLRLKIVLALWAILSSLSGMLQVSFSYILCQAFLRCLSSLVTTIHHLEKVPWMCCSMRSPHSDRSGFCCITKKVIFNSLSCSEAIIPPRKWDRNVRRTFFSRVIMMKHRTTRGGFSTLDCRISVLQSAKMHAKMLNYINYILNKLPGLFSCTWSLRPTKF